MCRKSSRQRQMGRSNPDLSQLPALFANSQKYGLEKVIQCTQIIKDQKLANCETVTLWLVTSILILMQELSSFESGFEFEQISVLLLGGKRSYQLWVGGQISFALVSVGWS